MPERVSLTLLQRGVIQRLREAGYAGLADLAHDHWSRGEPIPGHGTAELPPSALESLIADFLRANAQGPPND